MKAMLKKFCLCVLTCLLAAAPGFAHATGTGTPLEAKAMVLRAIDYMRANGEQKALQEFDKLNGKFQWRDLYVFAYDLKGTMQAHPNQTLIGKALYNEPDSRGRLFRKEIVELTKSRGSGWVDYVQFNPITQQEEAKISYCQKEKQLIVCCGAYMQQ